MSAIPTRTTATEQAAAIFDSLAHAFGGSEYVPDHVYGLAIAGQIKAGQVQPGHIEDIAHAIVRLMDFFDHESGRAAARVALHDIINAIDIDPDAGL